MYSNLELFNGSGFPSVLIVEGKNDVFIVENNDKQKQFSKFNYTGNNKKLKTDQKNSCKYDQISSGIASIPKSDISTNSLERRNSEIIPTFNSRWIEDKEDENVGFFPELSQSSNGADTHVDIKFISDSSNTDSEEFFETKYKNEHEKIKKPAVKLPKDSYKGTLLDYRKRFLLGIPECKYCDTVFGSKAEKLEHKCPYLQCSNPKNYICRFCNKERCKRDFRNHLHDVLECQYCGKKLMSKRRLKCHIDICHKDEPPLPPIEKKMENTEEKLKLYQEAYEKLKQNKIRERRRQIKVKQKSRKEEELFQCDYCGKYLAQKETLKFHMYHHTTFKPFICPKCGIGYPTYAGMKFHKCGKIKTRNPFSPYHSIPNYCFFCNIQFKCHIDNKNHVCIYNHPQKGILIFCRFCGLAVYKSRFLNHLKCHKGLNKFCTICSIQFKTQVEHNAHMPRHLKIENYQCDYCPERFNTLRQSQNHVSQYHSGEKKLSCDYCFKVLKSIYNLQDHIRRVHEKRNHCELCKKEFSSRDLLKSHLLNDHEPNICQICGKNYVLPRYLNTHMKLHLGGPKRIRAKKP